MGQKIVEFAQSLKLLERLVTSSTPVNEPWEKARQLIYAMLRNQVGHDFSGYKVKTFLRRVQKRMQFRGLDSIDAYTELLSKDHKEVHALFRELLINVTSFFRDEESFEQLNKLVIPHLFEGRGANDSIRVWIPGCATGEEVYSIAILLREYMDTLTALPRLQIFATDIDEAALAVGRHGRYPEALLEGVSPERKSRFFISDGTSSLIAKEVRDLCVFSPHSVIRDPPFSHIDLVSCRNLLIYFGVEVQKLVIPTFHYSLRPGGYLFLGPSENVNQFSDLFTPLDKQHRIFRSRDVGTAVRLPVASFGPTKSPSRSIVLNSGQQRSPFAGLAIRQAAEAKILEEFAPAHVVINGDGDALFFSGKTGKYLELAAGAPTKQLLAMARKGLRLELRGALREALETKTRTIRRGLVAEGENALSQNVTVTITPMPERANDEPLFLVVFVDEGPAVSSHDFAGSSADDLTTHLEREVKETREKLQSLIEENETALEELKSSNEELVSVNEELQSTNEELEASKEEMQSLNEELHTVNADLSAKVDALDAANNDLQNLFESTQVATVFLDKSLVIRSFTPAVAQIFNILPSDQGRPITDLTTQVPLPTLSKDVKAVLSEGRSLERRIDHGKGGRSYFVRVAPYRDLGHRTGGVVLTFVDVTSLTKAEAHQKVLIAELNHRVKNMLSVIIAIAKQTRKSTASVEAFETAFIDRLHAMARSHELLSKENWTEASIADLIGKQLAPFDLKRIKIKGPEIKLDPAQALSVGLAIHELATNAGKYGALSVPDGSIDVTWSVENRNGQDYIKIAWQEKNGPKVSPPSHNGFGLTLVEREIGFTLDGEATIEFAPEGLSAILMFPVQGIGS